MEGMLTKGQRIATAVVRITAGAMFLTAGLEKALGRARTDHERELIARQIERAGRKA